MSNTSTLTAAAPVASPAGPVLTLFAGESVEVLGLDAPPTDDPALVHYRGGLGELR